MRLRIAGALLLLAGTTVWAVAGEPAPAIAGRVVPAATGVCGPMDVALVLDTSTSMNPAIDSVRSGVGRFIQQVEIASGGDYRLGLVDFGNGVTVHVPFADQNGGRVRQALQGLSQSGDNDGFPEDSDVALERVVRNEGGFSVPWRPDATRLIVLVTDARPAGGDDDFDNGVDDQHLWDTAAEAGEQGITVGAFFVPNGNHEPRAEAMLEDAARLGNGPFFTTRPDAGNLTQGLELLITGCGADSDGDGLYDIWETDGYDHDGDGVIDVDLPALGADPDHKDLFIQASWMAPDGVVPCYLIFFCPPSADGAHPPRREALQRVVDAFAEAPVENPDGEPGVTVHFDAGDQTPSSGLPEADREGGPVGFHRDFFYPDFHDDDPDLSALSSARRAAVSEARQSLFTFAFYVHNISPPCPDPKPEGCWVPVGLAAGIPADSFLISGRDMDNVSQEATTFMHELGHTLGLRHGGPDHVGYKPNYLSVMNYSFAADGLITDSGGWVLDYSRFELGPLDERGGLDEPTGVPEADTVPERFQTVWFCDNEARIGPLRGPKNWDCVGGADGHAITAVIHNTFAEDRSSNLGGCPPSDQSPRRLCSQDDWAAIDFTGGVRGGLESPSTPIPDNEEQLTTEDYLDAPREFGLRLIGGGSYGAAPGAEHLQLAFRVQNIGSEDDDYTVDVVTEADWEDPAVDGPSSLSLAAGEEQVLALSVAIPEDASRGDALSVEVSVQSEGANHVTAVGLADLVVDASADAQVTEGELVIDPGSARPGDEIEISGTGFAATSATSAWLEPDSVLASPLSSETGSVAATVTVPDVEPGRTTVSLIGQTDDGGLLLLEGRLDIEDDGAVAPTDEDDEGSSGLPGWLLPAAGVLVILVLGLFAGPTIRRRRSGTVEPAPPVNEPVAVAASSSTARSEDARLIVSGSDPDPGPPPGPRPTKLVISDDDLED